MNKTRCVRDASHLQPVMTLLALGLLLAVGAPANAQTYTVIHNFSGAADGSAPVAGVSIDQSGRLYGTTSSGGYTGPNCNYQNYGNGCGAVYRLTQHGSGWTMESLYVFIGGQDGSSPWARVIQGPDGSFFGTTTFGGIGPCVNEQYGPGCGTIFRLQPPAHACASVSCPWLKTTLYMFDGNGAGSQGGNPMAEVVFDAAGNFYGTASVGGTYGYGVVYEMAKTNSGWTYNVIHSFAGPPNDSGGPQAGLILDRAGNLYGTGAAGPGAGGIYEVSPPTGNGWTEQVLYALNPDGSEGNSPYGGLVSDPAGNLYGTTAWQGANNAGTAFELSPNGNNWTFSLLTSFPNNGCLECLLGSTASLYRDNAGNLYGTAPYNGSSGYCGDVFKMAPFESGYVYSTLYNFQCQSDGAFPESNLVPDSSGHLIGTASGGGSTNHGVVFTVTP